jgi:hypothetical protein
MYQMIEQEMSRQAEQEARRSGLRALRLHDADATVVARPAAPDIDVAIRAADSRDVPELMRLAELDSRPLPVGKLLVAEAAGRIRAAIAIDGEAVIADPFVATAELQSLLKLRAEQVRRERGQARRTGLLGALHLRPGRTA